MTLVDIEHYTKQMLTSFPNSYTYTKRMAEHVLVENNSKRIPLLILRPSIVSASFAEPFPGWTDSISLIGGIYLVAGLGIMRDLPANPASIGD